MNISAFSKSIIKDHCVQGVTFQLLTYRHNVTVSSSSVHLILITNIYLGERVEEEKTIKNLSSQKSNGGLSARHFPGSLDPVDKFCEKLSDWHGTTSTWKCYFFSIFFLGGGGGGCGMYTKLTQFTAFCLLFIKKDYTVVLCQMESPPAPSPQKNACQKLSACGCSL